MSKKKIISNSGMPLVSGLESLTSIVVYQGEFVNFGNALAYGSELANRDTHSTTATDYIGDTLTNQFPTNVGEYYRFRTSGSPYTAVTAPESSGGFFVFHAQKTGGLPSHGGIYQKLSGLNPGFEYKIIIESAIDSDTGTLTVETYCDKGYSSLDPVFLQTSSQDITYPKIGSGASPKGVNGSGNSITESSFIAESSNDVLLLRFTTDETSSQSVSIVRISVEEKQEFLVPTFTNTSTGIAQKVLSKPTFKITDSIV